LWAAAALVWASGAAAQPAGQQGQPPPPAGRAQTPPAKVPDEEFIEFLGEDDHGDAAWWEFLKKTQPGAQNPAPPPQGSKQS